MTSNGPPNLAIRTSLSPVSSSSIGVSTPENAQTLKEFCESVNLTPPAKADTIGMAMVRDKVNHLLAPVNVNWNHLTPRQQAKISYLLMRKQDTFLLNWKSTLSANTELDVARALHASLDETNFHGKRLDAFVRKGGDIVVKDDREYVIPSPYKSFLNGREEWLDPEAAPTLFNHPDNFKRVAKPLLWLQEETSTVCYLVSIATAIFYSQCMHNGTTPDDTSVAVGLYALNVSRFMRDEFTDEEVFANIFLGEGGHPDAMIHRLLQPKNPGVRVFSNFHFHLDHSVDFVFQLAKASIRKFGALVVERFKTFVGFDEDNGELVFHGDWNEKPKLPANKNPNHALLIVGVRQTSSIEEMGGLAFLAQNSSAKKPFVIIGLDLLRSMDVVEALAIEVGLKFDTGEWDHDNVSPALIQNGSPRIFDAPERKEELSWSPGIETRSREAVDTASSHHRYWQPIDLETISHKIT